MKHYTEWMDEYMKEQIDETELIYKVGLERCR